MDRDEIWAAWAEAGHAGCEGWMQDPDGPVICACGQVIEVGLSRCLCSHTAADHSEGSCKRPLCGCGSYRPGRQAPAAGMEVAL